MSKNKCHTLLSCNNSGWVLVYALVFVLVIQAASLFALTIIKHNVKSGNIFHTILKKTHAPEMKARPPQMIRRTLDAPDGWDHAAFATELVEKTWGSERTFSWRAALRQQPVTIASDPLLSLTKPYLIILLDDSQTMGCSCGKTYDDKQVYLEYPAGEIVPVPYRDDVQTSMYTQGGTYFRGDYGNIYHTATDTHHFGGTLSSWTYVLSYIKGLLEDLAMCEVAIASTSHGIIQPFTRDIRVLYSALESLHPHAATSPLSESLAGLLDDFPDECITGRDIIVATSGISIDDGSLPAWLADFDNDNNPQDCYIEGSGSHCLDDVAAYASSLNIRVHTAGPDTAYLRNVAQKGGGVYMPAKRSMESIPDFVCQMKTATQNVTRFLVNTEGTFDPDWLIDTSPTFYQAGPYDPLHLTLPPSLFVRGIATSQFTSGQTLLCATSRDYLLAIDMAAGNLRWVMQGLGGKITRRGETIVAGPNLHGYIHAVGNAPEIIWRQKGDLFESSMGSTYIARDNTITSLALETGFYLTEASTASDISCLRYDPCSGLLLAGTTAGMIYIFTADLDLVDILVSNAHGSICDMRTFDWRKTLHVLAFTPERAICTTQAELLWSKELDNGTYTNAVVMDKQAYISTWSRDDGCEGTDTGRSYLMIIDALSGKKLSEKILFPGLAFGPLIDLAGKRIEYNSWDMRVHAEDISGLDGISYSSLGSQRIQNDP